MCKRLETSRPMNRNNSFAMLSRWCLLCRVALLALAIRADWACSGQVQASAPLQDVSPGVAGIPRAAAATQNPAASNAPAYMPFEQPPQKVDVFQLQKLQQIAAQNRERSQTRVVLPPDALVPRPKFDPASAGGHDEAPAPPLANRFQPGKGFNRICLCILLAGIGALAARKFIQLLKIN